MQRSVAMSIAVTVTVTTVVIVMAKAIVQRRFTNRYTGSTDSTDSTGGTGITSDSWAWSGGSMKSNARTSDMPSAFR